jgi:predicted aspartyl protease
LRGWIAYAFNDVPQAEREYLAIINQEPASRFRREARDNLAEIYWRNGMVQKALRYYRFVDRLFYRRFAKYPEMSVTHSGYARFQTTRDSGGHIMLPVVAAGKDASYVVDTGANKSMLRLSEARRLGLKLEPARMGMVNGMAKVVAHLTIVPVLMVGATRLENVPFWVLPDARLDWCPGIFGIDVLLKLETLRWDAGGAAEIGFPAEQKDIRNANLCFWRNDVFADVSAYGQGNMIFLLDSGTPRTELYSRFAARFPDLVSANSKASLDPYTWNAFGARRDFKDLTVPEIMLSIGGSDWTLHQGGVLLERRPGQNERHGIIGVDLLNSARRVTLDLNAMRLTLE